MDLSYYVYASRPDIKRKQKSKNSEVAHNTTSNPSYKVVKPDSARKKIMRNRIISITKSAVSV
jgi:hypothetical protein